MIYKVQLKHHLKMPILEVNKLTSEKVTYSEARE